MNRLEQEKSAYLKHAASQKIDWYPWSEEAFERAQKENKPVFLSSGAVWCHWCHVMAKECFENDEIARILNERFVAVKLDRDERPDIDRRYQQALAAMGMSGGWPMSVFLTHEKKAFYGGTYFPSDDRFGKPGFKTILTSLSEFYATRGKEVHENADKLHDFLKKRGPKKQKVDQTDTEDAAKTMLENFDRLHGGFGSAPKFAMSGAIEFLLGRYFFKKEQTLEYAIRKTLVAMAGGGFHDQLGGGFHRYSMDEAWIVPHFEKMADDNAWLLRNYIDAYSIFGDEFFKKIAENIVYFIRKELSHAEGGFYASMDADVTPDDEGGYFTWTDDQLRQTLSPDEYAVFSLYFLHKGRTMHHDDKKFVLSVCMGVNDIAQNSRMDVDKVTSILETARRKLLAERDKRQKPFVDTALYTSLNGIMISACLRASRVLCDDTLKGFALKSLERILEINISD
ncbi:MAG TPA: thioredoxin domain-containing protein, partial [Syntrophorhabdaceae bacterium]|nr:thioredoxin domain-containing protein [Syntrophorhabdaceae bacterium]